jgi:ERF superfamily protein
VNQPPPQAPVSPLQPWTPGSAPPPAPPAAREVATSINPFEGGPVELARMPGIPGLAPPTGKLFSALLAAQMAVQKLEEKGEVAFKTTRYTYATATQFILEARRVLHGVGLLVVQLGALGAPDAKARRTVLYSSFAVIHAESGEGITVPFEWVVHATEKMAPPKALGASYTNSLRYFLRGLLLIATGDHEDPESAYPQGPYGYGGEQAPQQGYQQPYQAPPPQQAPPQSQYSAPAHAPYPNAPAPWPPQQDYQQPYQAPPPQQGYQAPPPAPAPEGYAPQPQGGAVPFANPPAGDVGRGTQAPSSSEVQAPSNPQGAEEWTRALIAVGWAPGLAEDLARMPIDQPIDAGIAEILHAEIEKVFGGDVEAARAAWQGTGFTPDPESKTNRPIPTGGQALRYAKKIKERKQ